MLAMLAAMDEAVGRLVDALRAADEYDNTVIVFTTDNGGSVSHAASNLPLRGTKGTLWEGGTRGPAFLHSPLLGPKARGARHQGISPLIQPYTRCPQG
jgi:arylsulfatase A-like enzyme